MSTLLVVCTANVCRSPVAAALLARDLAAVGVEVTSAGTEAVPGMPAAPEAVEVVRRELGLGLEHRSRPLTAALLEQADLVLTMTREQSTLVTAQDPRALRRVFTLRELARILPSLPPPDGPEELRSLARDCARHRSRVRRDLTGEGAAAAGRSAAGWGAEGWGAASRSAGGRGAADPAALDVADPTGLSPAHHARAFAQILEAASRIAAGIAPRLRIGGDRP